MLRQNRNPPPASAAKLQCAEGRARNILLGTLLLTAVWFAYFPAVRGGLLWDDAAHVTAPALRSVRGLERIWFDLGATQQYYPVLHTAFWVEHRLWGDSAFGYHAANLMLHGCAALLFWALLRRLEVRWAWWAAFAFALHPVCVESVAWISEQKNTLSLVFCLLAALSYLRFEDALSGRRAGDGGPSRRAGFWRRPSTLYALSGAFFVLALLSKTVTATLPAALLVVLWWRRGGLSWRRDVLPLVPWFAAAGGAGALTAWVERNLVGAHGSGYALTGLMRVLLAGRAVCFYLGKLLWPVNLAFIYPHWTLDPGVFWQWLFPIACLAAVGLLGALRSRSRGPLACGLLFAGMLFPALGFFNVYPFAYSYVADHFQYHASLAIFAAAAACAGWVYPRDARSPGSPGGAALGAAALAILVALTFQTREQCRMYADIETLYRATLLRNPDCAMAHNNLGVLLARSGRSAEAVSHYERAIQVKPDYAEAENNLGDELLKVAGREGEAVAHFEAALRIRPDYVVAEDNLANALAVMPGRWPEAERHYAAALRLRPDYAKAHNDLAIALARVAGRRAEALDHYEAALRLDPDFAQAHANYAFELAREPGGVTQALAHYARALELDPENAVAHNNLANLLATIPGRSADARSHYEAALRLNPEYAEAHNNLANELAKDPSRLPEALAHYEAAVRLKPDYAEAHNNLAIADANLGKLDEAALHFRLALKFKPDFKAARDNLNLLLAPAR